MALPDLTGQNIENTYQRVIQTDGTNFYDGTGSLVNFGGAVFPYTGSAIISGSLIVTGSTDIQYLTASGLNYPTIDGDEKQLIATDGSGNLFFDWADRTNLDVKNTSGTTLALGTPVYISGFQGASIFQISPSSASISSSMPAVGVLSQELAPNEQGHATILGALRGYNTSLYSVNNSLYVGEGILTKDRPTGSALIQKIARVGNSQNNGEITIIGAGRSNDVPNLPPGYAWIGNENWVATAVPTSSFNEDPFPYTGSAAISGSLEVTGDVTIYGTASVNVLITNYESSSIIYSSGSTKFGDSLDDTHIFTGSVSITGSLDVDNTITAVTGSFSHLKGNSPITVQDSVFFQQGLTNTGSAVISGSLEVIGPVSASSLDIGNELKINGQAASNGDTRVGIGNRTNPTSRQIAIGSVLANRVNAVQIGGRDVGGGESSVVIGDNAGGNNTNLGIIGIGQNAGRFAGANVTFIGYNAGYLGGSQSTGIGDTAGAFLRGSHNTSIGNGAGVGTAYVSNVSYNTFIGSLSGNQLTSGSGNVFLGYGAGQTITTSSNQLIIANNSLSALVTGDFANNTFNISGSVSASTYYGDGSNLTGISSDPFPYTGSAIISGSLEVIGDITGSNISASTYYGDGSNLTGIDSGSWDGIFTGSAEITGSLEVIGDITTNTLSNISTTLASDTATNVDTFNTASYTGAIYDYILVNATVGARAGQFMVAQDNGDITFTDTSTTHLNDTPIPEISAQINGADVEVQVTNGNGYTFKSFVKKL